MELIVHPSASQAEAHAFGRRFARDGWSLDSARHLGALAGFDADEVQAGYQEQTRPSVIQHEA